MLGILRRVFSFADWTQHHPKEPIPGDMLDASFDAQNQRIAELEALVAQILRSDGALQNETVGWDSFRPEIMRLFEDRLQEMTSKVVDRVLSLTMEAKNSGNMAFLAEQEAKSANALAQETGNRIQNAKNIAISHLTALNERMKEVSLLLEDAAEVRTDWDDASAEAQAWAQSSALWAEHMPDTLPDNAVKLMDITGDHWSSRWWANQAANAFGMLTSLYLGVHSTPPVTNNNGGPIETGSIYYDSDDHMPYVWTGSSWEPFYAGVNRAAVSTLWYEAIAGETEFDLEETDLNGRFWTVSPDDQIAPHVNGIRLMPGSDFTISGSIVTFLRPLRAGDLVAFDVLMSPEQLAPGAVQAYALKPLVGIDGSATVFDLETKIVPSVPVAVQSYEELLVSLDGVIQEPGVSFTAAGDTITFLQAPGADSHVFITWLKPKADQGWIELTQAEYDALSPPDPDTLYVVVG